MTLPTAPIPQPSTPITNALRIVPKTETETILLEALKESDTMFRALRDRVAVLQASQILNDTYCNKLRIQLAHKEKKKGKQTLGKLMGNGLPRMLSGDAFYEQVVQFTEWQRSRGGDEDGC
ncbi:hypothetical protein CC1G_13541 [Coprinopsis cinerea okayama7|uniref:Uncharacterized protein n=1 Tax=Coprinopsis cinerea (strain Okayama-7 / 130 / ATCC MYA-4618 / FGSC 9003) TaxID=240176 RepID=A8PIS4_COPC7|nr:hypothetical protein CC1G_13541 [Coprinopsis cinerea okayama7\|eukprot:XP_001841612.2 hypothetical protein CC1G_13541 [Coprinopsis cinerea okayama7\